MRGVLERLKGLDELDDTTWCQLILALLIVALGIRMYIGRPGAAAGYDFDWYRQVGAAARHGNPYTAHLIPPTDVPPLQALTFGVLGEPAGAPLRSLLALADLGTIALIGFVLKQSRGWRLNLACWIALNPMLLLIWDMAVEDKNLYILCVVAAMAAVQAARPFWALAAAGTFALFKYVGAFLVPPIALMTARIHGWRKATFAVTALAVIFAVSQLPWFPDSLDAISRRQGRASGPHPFHTTWTILLDRIHLYDPMLVKVITVGGLAAAYGLLLIGRIGTVESMTLALIATFIALPDSSPDRIMLLTVLFILITPLSAGGWALLWITSTIGALANGILQSIPLLTGLNRTTDLVAGSYGGVRSVILTNLPLFSVIALYAMSHMSNASLRSFVDRRVRKPVHAG